MSYLIEQKSADMILIEDLPSLKKENTFNVFNLNSEDSEDGEDKMDEDIIFKYDRYSLTTIRKEVIKGLRKNL